MKNTMKTMLLFLAATLVLAGCKEDEKIPPVAGFTLDNETLVQWDKATITSTATGATETTYAVTGGQVEIDEATGVIQFLEALTYKITQTVTNADGTVETSQDITVTEPVNTYNFDYLSNNALLLDSAYWFLSGETQQIRFNGQGESAQETSNVTKVIPVTGPDALSGSGTRSYTFSDADPLPIGTYTTQFTHYPATGTGWEGAWFYPISGTGLDITLVYEDPSNSADNVYDIKLYDTSYNEYFLGFTSTAGDGTLTITFRGRIKPIQ